MLDNLSSNLIHHKVQNTSQFVLHCQNTACDAKRVAVNKYLVMRNLIQI